MKPLYTQEQFNNARFDEKLPIECYYCHETFYSIPKEIRKVLNNHPSIKLKYCSKKCAGLDKITKQKINCNQCGIEFEKFKSQIKKTKNHFCSRSCSTIYNNIHKIGYRRSKLEIWLESKLTTLYPGYKILFNDRTEINSELDIYFPELRLAFELNGIFHYEAIHGQEKLDKTQNNDNRKFQACLEQGIELCIIDTSTQKYVKESTSKKYLDIIINIISNKLIFNAPILAASTFS